MRRTESESSGGKDERESKSTGDCRIEILRRYVPYAVDTATPVIKSYHDAIFGGVMKPLCNTMQSVNGFTVDGCEMAAAFTSWKITTDDVLYKVERGRGVKQTPYNISASISTALPQWKQIDRTTEEERGEVRRFEMRTAYHERGHSLACENAIQAISRFVHCMPATVSTSEVAALNESAARFIKEFYIRMSRRADVQYDAFTGHGRTQGAEARDEV